MLWPFTAILAALLIAVPICMRYDLLAYAWTVSRDACGVSRVAVAFSRPSSAPATGWSLPAAR